MTLQRRKVVPKSTIFKTTTKTTPTGQELAILKSLENNVPSLVQEVTQMEAYINAVNQHNIAPSPFPFPTIDGKPLPALFLAEPSLLGAPNSLNALIPFSKRMKTVSSRIEIHGQGGNNTSNTILLSDLTQMVPANTLTTGLKKVTEAFVETTISSSERFVGAFMQGIVTTQKSTGLLLDSKELINSITALAEGTGIGIPEKMNEDVRKMVETLTKKKEDTISSRTAILREKEEKINNARNKGTREIQAIIKNFMNELDEIRQSEIKIATGLLTDELEYREQLEKVVQYANMPSHMIPVNVWLKIRGVEDPNLCFLTGSIIGDDTKKTCLFVSEPMDGIVRVSLYTALVKDIINRTMYGLPLFGEKPPTIDLSNYAGVMDPLGGLCKWIKNTQTISRRPEDQIVSCRVISPQDVLLILRDPKVAPWWKFAQCFSLYEANPTKLPSSEDFKKIVEAFNGQIPDDLIAVIISKFDALKHKARANDSVLVPSDFKDAYKEYIEGKPTKFKNSQKNHPFFHAYFEALRGLVGELSKLINNSSFQFSNPAHV
jgi:hypothetical protein